MGLRDIFARSDDFAEASLTASARVVSREAGGPQSKADKKHEAKQDEVWAFYDEIAELWFGINFIANALRRVRIFPARYVGDDQPPQPLTDADGTIGVLSNLEMDRLRSTDGSHGELLHDMSMQFTIPGEGILYGSVDDLGFESFSIKSISEIFWDNSVSNWMYCDGPGERPVEVAPGSYVSRFWRQHPRWSERADSGLFSVTNECKEFLTLQHYMRNLAKRRINAGLLLWPKEAEVRDAQLQSGAPVAGQAAKMDPLLRDLSELMSGAADDEDSPFNVVPGIIKMKGEWIEKVRHFVFGAEYEDKALARMEALTHRIVTGVDLPNEVVFGLGELTHWNAWQVDEGTFDDHLAPLLTLICNGLTEAFLRPALSVSAPGVAVNDVVVWFDGSALLSHPNKGPQALEANAAGVIGFEATRKYIGYSEDDAPTADDIALLERVKTAGRTGQNPTGPVIGPPPSPEASLTASGAPEQLGRRLRDIDYSLRTRLQIAAQGVVFRALERNGAKMRAKVRNHSTYGPLVKDVDNSQVCFTLGEDAVRSYFTVDELTDDAIAPIIPVWNRYVGRAQAEVRRLAHKDAVDDQLDDDRWEQEQEQNRAEGLSNLKIALAGVVAAQLFGTAANAVVGEFDDTLLVPPGVVREALTVAGGGTPGGGTHTATEIPEGGVATGDDAMEILAAVGLTADAWVWTYGDPSSRGTVFEAHEALDDVEFLDWSDERLQVQPGDEWLGTDHYYPGDHYYCQCDYYPVFRNEET